MRVRVKLFGTLSQRFPGYQPTQGIEIDIPDGVRVKDLLAHLKISKYQWGVVSMESRILRTDDKLQDGASMHVFQAVHGG